MSRKIFACVLPLVAALSSAPSFASAVLTSGHFNFTAIPIAPVITATASSAGDAPILITHHIDLPSQNNVVYATTLTADFTTIVVTNYNVNSGTMSISGSTPSAVPLAGGGLYFAGALLPLVMRRLKRRR